ncbi:thioredoxin [Candidatus Bathyarchaeota archaeon]|nr:thioredoxin [Candidatus Bathyarchaeota archaeon]
MDGDKELQTIREKRLRELKKTLEKTAEGGNSRKLASDKPTELTDQTFAGIIQGQGLVVVDCWAVWCGPCRMIAPIVEELARDYSGKILFAKLNVDENPQTAEQYGIMSIPTLLVFKAGKLLDRIVGLMPRQMLETRITHYL